jgi:archaellum biogenesis ATPase FlaH
MQNPIKIVITLISICVFGFTSHNSSTVLLTNHQKQVVPFKIKSQKIDWVNNIINLALLSTDNKLIQINNIPENMLKDTTFRNRRVQVVLIDSTSKTFTQNKRFLTLVEIKCNLPEPGQTFAINAQGKVFHENQWYRFNVKTTQVLPKEKNLGTSKKMITN